MTAKSTKIFCIGLSKTGTTSLAAALEILGFRTKDNLGVTHYSSGDLESSVDLSIIDEYDAFTDTPIPSFYRELDARYPNAKFILTVRELNPWLISCKKQFNQRATEKRDDATNHLFNDIYDSPFFDEEKFTTGYQRFVNEALDYFKNRPDDLLVIDISAGEGWDKLCSFLNKPIPDLPFPKSNVTQIQWIAMDELFSIAGAAGAELVNARGKIARLSSSTKNSLRAMLVKLIHGDRDKIVANAIDKARQTIIERLSKLTPNIPVLFNEHQPYSDRKSWNYVWLIDPLIGTDPFLNGSDDFCLSIALIQDGTPVYGVIHFPMSNTSFYGKRGKGVYFKQNNGECRKFEASVSKSEESRFVLLNRQNKSLEELKKTLNVAHPKLQLDQIPTIENIASAFRSIIQGETSKLFIADSLPEWQHAGLNAILRELGKDLYDFETQSLFRYNQPDLYRHGVIAA
ncbi:inositol monophosphatase family protein [Methylotuvimicrobium sp. KM1]|uniref:inositol monophosphatase family protein n=1 Tax=Methylotuvimicrobium sp. KM1 TaxID=3377707 RepID=UPI00384C3AC1